MRNTNSYKKHNVRSMSIPGYEIEQSKIEKENGDGI